MVDKFESGAAKFLNRLQEAARRKPRHETHQNLRRHDAHQQRTVVRMEDRRSNGDIDSYYLFNVFDSITRKKTQFEALAAFTRFMLVLSRYFQAGQGVIVIIIVTWLWWWWMK